MDQEQSVNAIMEYVSSLEACPHIQELKAVMDELESGRETLGVILNEKLDEILKETMQVREDVDLWREKGAEEEREKVKVEREIQEMQQKKMVTEEEKRRCLERLERATNTLQGCKASSCQEAALHGVQIDSGFQSKAWPSEGLCCESTQGRCESV